MPAESATYKNCQSCSMPMKRDPKGGGTNADGSRNAMYCSHCWVEGNFSRPEIDTQEQMQVLVKEKLKEFGIPGFLCGFFTRRIPRLERWKGARRA